jgi:hypothetical protein
MPMTVSDFSRSRPAADPSNKRRPLAAVRSLIARVISLPRKLVSSTFVRVVLIFLVGFAAGMAWQSSHADGIRKTIAGWSPRLAWIAPGPASSAAAAERLKATSVALAGVRQSVDKLATELDRLQAQDRQRAQEVSDQRAASASHRASQRR